MCFDFIGMQRMYLSLARGDAGPLAEALRDRPQPPKDAHWATFVRNHDELTLDKLSEAQRQEVFDAFGPKPDMQLYGRGLRRRLPPMVDGDQRRIRMVYSLLFALPGTPVLFYGEEIGMGENLEAEGRLAVRVPMQWTAEPGAGFSTARPSTFPAPLRRGRVRARARQRPRPVARPGLAAVVLPAPRRLLPRPAPSWPGAATRCSTRAEGRVGPRPPRRRRRCRGRRRAQLRRTEGHRRAHARRPRRPRPLRRTGGHGSRRCGWATTARSTCRCRRTGSDGCGPRRRPGRRSPPTDVDRAHVHHHTPCVPRGPSGRATPVPVRWPRTLPG